MSAAACPPGNVPASLSPLKRQASGQRGERPETRARPFCLRAQLFGCPGIQRIQFLLAPGISPRITCNNDGVLGLKKRAESFQELAPNEGTLAITPHCSQLFSKQGCLVYGHVLAPDKHAHIVTFTHTRTFQDSEGEEELKKVLPPLYTWNTCISHFNATTPQNVNICRNLKKKKYNHLFLHLFALHRTISDKIVFIIFGVVRFTSRCFFFCFILLLEEFSKT